MPEAAKLHSYTVAETLGSCVLVEYGMFIFLSYSIFQYVLVDFLLVIMDYRIL